MLITMNIRKKTDDPENIILILANPRSGSTWLLDLLRCHPAVKMIESGTIYRNLGLEGRRYPLDLSKDIQSGLRLEVRPDRGKWDTIPEFFLQKEYQLAYGSWSPSYAIEKIHPHFFHFDIPIFLDRINQYERTTQISMVYLVRDPLNSIRSFFAYQERNPSWNKNREGSEVMIHMQKIYQTIAELTDLYPGLIVDYQQLSDDFIPAMSRIISWLWPDRIDCNSIEIEELVDALGRSTAREKRKNKNKGKLFLGDRDGKKYLEMVSRIKMSHFSELELCYQPYQKIISKLEDKKR